MALIDGHGKGNTRRTGEMRFGKTADAPGPVLVRRMTEEERKKYGAPAASPEPPSKITYGYHLDDATREAIKQDLLAVVGQRTIEEKYHVPAQLISYYRVQLQKQGLLTPSNGTSRTRRPTPKGDDEMARLTDDEKEALQADLVSRAGTNKKLAKKYGVVPSVVSYYADKIKEGMPSEAPLDTQVPETSPEDPAPPQEEPPAAQAAEPAEEPTSPSRQEVLADALQSMQTSLAEDLLFKGRAYEEARMRVQAAEMLRKYLKDQGLC